MHIAQTSQTQELPDWLRYTTLYDSRGRATATAIYQLPLSYSGSSIPLGWPWTQAGSGGPTVVSILGGSVVTLSSTSSLPAQTDFAATQASGSPAGLDTSQETTNGSAEGDSASSDGFNGSDSSGDGSATSQNGEGSSQGGADANDPAGPGADGSSGAGSAADNDAGEGSDAGSDAPAGVDPQAGATATQLSGNAPLEGQTGTEGVLPTQTDAFVPMSAATGSLTMSDGQVVPAIVSTQPNGALTTLPLTATTLLDGSTALVPLSTSISRSVTLSNGQVVPAVLSTLSNGVITTLPLVATTLANGQTTLVPLASSAPSLTLSNGRVVPATIVTMSNGALTTQPLVPSTLPNGSTTLVPSLVAAQGSSGLSGGAIAGITLGSIVAALLLGLCGLSFLIARRKRGMSDERRVLGRDLSWQRSSSNRNDPDVREAMAGLIAYRDSPDADAPLETASSRSQPWSISGLSQAGQRLSQTALAGASGLRQSPDDFRLSGSTAGADDLFFSVPRTPPSRNSGSTARPPFAEHSSSGSGSSQSAYASTAHQQAFPLPPASAAHSKLAATTSSQDASMPATGISATALGVANPALRDSTGSTAATSTAEYFDDDVRRDSALSAEGAPILTAAKETTGRVLSGLGLAQLFGVERTASDMSSSAPRRTGPIALGDDSPTLGYGPPFSTMEDGTGSTPWSTSALGAPILRAGPQRSVSHHFATASAASGSERRIASDSSMMPQGESSLRRRIGNPSDEDLPLPYDVL